MTFLPCPPDCSTGFDRLKNCECDTLLFVPRTCKACFISTGREEKYMYRCRCRCFTLVYFGYMAWFGAATKPPQSLCVPYLRSRKYMYFLLHQRRMSPVVSLVLGVYKGFSWADTPIQPLTDTINVPRLPKASG